MKNLTTVPESNEWEWTTNLTVYNKLHKKRNAKCAFCAWNCGCNEKNSKWYGGHERYRGRVYANSDVSKRETVIPIRYPSWKLATKNKKQWMAKPKKYQIVESVMRHSNLKSVTINF